VASVSPIAGNTYLLTGVPVRVLAAWSGRGPHNVLVETPDGRRFVRPFRGLRVPESEKQRRIDKCVEEGRLDDVWRLKIERGDFDSIPGEQTLF
jgi:hypothetical protein